MELYIRSKDRTRLVKMNNNMVIKHSLKSEFTGYQMYVDETYLGEYATKERALEILDEIQRIVGWIQKDMKYTTIGEVNHLIGCYDNYVYEMPKE